jgi:PAS domain-containing protein
MRLFHPLRTARAAACVYEPDQHRVLDANTAMWEQWGYSPDAFVGTSDGLFGLWVNPLDWEIHGDLLEQCGVCVGLRTRLARVDGRYVEADVTSVRLDAGKDGRWVVTYVLPVGIGQGLPIHFEDERDFRHLLAQPEADAARASLLGPTGRSRPGVVAGLMNMDAPKTGAQPAW